MRFALNVPILGINNLYQKRNNLVEVFCFIKNEENAVEEINGCKNEKG